MSASADRQLAEPALPPPVGVRGLPFFGVLFSLRRNPLAFFSRLLRERGDRVSFRILGRHVLLLSHPNDFEEILVRDRESYGRSAELLALRSLFGKGLLASEGALWRRQRTLIQPSFGHDAIERYAAVMLAQIATQSARWQPGQTIDVHAEMLRYTRDVICTVLFGSSLPSAGPALGQAVSTVFGDLRHEILYLPLWRRLPLPRARRWNRAVALLRRSITQLIADRRASSDTGNDLLGHLLRARDLDGNGMSGEQLMDEILTFFLAGHETAALALTWSAYLLARHPEAQRQARQELIAVTGGEPLQPAHYGRLRYLAAVVKEALRLYPPVWSLGRKAVGPTSLGSYAVPPKTDLWLCLYRLHRDPRWYSQPEEFQPERWLHETNRPPFTFLPFGVGPRVCIGQHFATAEAVLGLASIFRQFHLAPLSHRPAALHPWITLRPKERIQLRLEPLA